jgi:hypothetical protein
VTRYRVRNAFIDAVQWTGDNETELDEFTGNGFFALDEDDRDDDPEATGALFETVHHTWDPVKPGDWVVRGGTGLFFKCQESDFAGTYELVDDTQAGDAL